MLVDIELHQILEQLDKENLDFLLTVFGAFVGIYEENADGNIVFLDEEDELYYRKAARIENLLFWELKERKNG